MRLRPLVSSFKPYTPGLSIDEVKDRYGLSKVIKLASNENPLGVSPMARRALEDRAGLAYRYPQAGTPRLAGAIAKRLGVPANCVVAGNGSDEIIDLILRVAVEPGKQHVLAFDPCFGIYDTQSRLCEVSLRQVVLTLEDDLALPLTALARAATPDTALVFVTCPDNPSGRAATAGEILALADALPPDCLLVVDEAYVDFARAPYGSVVGEVPGRKNLVVMRTFSKAYGLAGVRLGYGVMPPELAEALYRVKLPFSVNLLAEEAGLAALEDEGFMAETIEIVQAGRDYLEAELKRLGCRTIDSQANFIMFRPPAQTEGGPGAQAVFDGLLQRGIIIRPLKSYGFPDWLRVSMGDPEENRVFIRELEAILAAFPSSETRQPEPKEAGAQ